MLRFFYIWLLGLHPRHFKQRFGDEMLSIFDEAAGHRGTGQLFADAFLSLLRQWALRSEYPQPPPVTEGGPVFYIGGSDTPRLGALIHGAMLSLIAFSAVCFMLSHGGAHLSVMDAISGFRYTAYSNLFGPPGTGDSSSDSVLVIGPGRPAAAGGKSSGALSKLTLFLIKPAHTQMQPAVGAYFRAILVLAALDTDHDGVISAQEIANAPEVLRKLDLNHDGKLSAQECGASRMSIHPVLAALDADHDGEIGAAEIASAVTALNTLDKNHDGQLTADELLPKR